MSENYISKIQIGESYYNIHDDQARLDITSLSTLKANINSPTFTGIPKAPTATTNDELNQIATIGYVLDAFKANDAMLFKGVLDNNHNLPASDYELGWTYKVAENGTYAGMNCEQGDVIICVAENGNNTDWVAIQTNIDGAVTGPINSTNNHVAVFDGTSGKIINDSGYVLEQSVTTGSKLTDTTYEAVTTLIGSATTNTPINAVSSINFNSGKLPTLTPTSFTTVNGWTNGVDGSAENIVTNKVTSWSTGTLIQKNDINVTKINSWSEGQEMTTTAVSVNEVESWNSGIFPIFSVENGDTLVLTAGTLPSLTTNVKNFNAVENIGKLPTLSTSTFTVSHVTNIGTLPSLSYEEQTVSKVESFGSHPTIELKNTSINNVTDNGTLPTLESTTTSIPNISVASIAVVTGISEV